MLGWSTAKDGGIEDGVREVTEPDNAGPSKLFKGFCLLLCLSDLGSCWKWSSMILHIKRISVAAD